MLADLETLSRRITKTSKLARAGDKHAQEEVEALKYLLMLINFFGFLIGMSAYIPQLTNSNPLLWILIIDCPLAVLLFILFLFGLRNPYFEALMRKRDEST